MKVACPICKKEVEYSPNNPFRPFCSERCKMIDLGEWADGKRAVPGDHGPTAEGDQPQKPESSDTDRQD